MKELKAKNYSAWGVNEKDFPKNGSIGDKVKFLLNYGVLAPSTHNTQPWLFTINKNKLQIRPNLLRQLPAADPKGRDLYISLGCCAQNIILAGQHFDMASQVSVTKEKPPIIEITFREDNSLNSDHRLFTYINKRFSYKEPYQKKKVPLQLLTEFKKLNLGHNTFIDFVTDKKQLFDIAILYEDTALAVVQHKEFRLELWSWMRASSTRSYTGMPGFVLGLNPVKDVVGRALLRFFPPFGKVTAKKYRSLIETSPAVGAITTAQDKETAWITAGRAYELFALHALSKQLNTTFLAAIIEDETARKKLQNKFLHSRRYPQIFFRMGYPPDVTYHTPRESAGQHIV